MELAQVQRVDEALRLGADATRNDRRTRDGPPYIVRLTVIMASSAGLWWAIFAGFAALRSHAHF